MSINDFRLYKKAQGKIDVSVAPEDPLDEEVVEEEEVDVPTSANKKQEIYDYLVARGEDPSYLDDKTKAQLLDLV